MNETKWELAQKVRSSIIGELDAINQYDRYYNTSDNPAAKAVWASIRDEEKVHVGELLTLLCYVDGTFAGYLNEGEKEAKELIGAALKS